MFQLFLLAFYLVFGFTVLCRSQEHQLDSFMMVVIKSVCVSMKPTSKDMARFTNRKSWQLLFSTCKCLLQIPACVPYIPGRAWCTVET